MPHILKNPAELKRPAKAIISLKVVPTLHLPEVGKGKRDRCLGKLRCQLCGRIIRKGGVIALFFYLLSVVYLATDGDKEVFGRCFLTFSVATAVFYYFWARNAKVVRAVLFRKDAFLEQWREAFASNESLKEEYVIIVYHPFLRSARLYFSIVFGSCVKLCFGVIC